MELLESLKVLLQGDESVCTVNIGQFEDLFKELKKEGLEDNYIEKIKNDLEKAIKEIQKKPKSKERERNIIFVLWQIISLSDGEGIDFNLKDKIRSMILEFIGIESQNVYL